MRKGTKDKHKKAIQIEDSIDDGEWSHQHLSTYIVV